MAGVPAPKKISNFPIANTLTANMVFLVADSAAGTNWQVAPSVIIQYVSSQLLPLNATQVRVFSSEFLANVTVNDSFNGQTLYYNGVSDVTLAFANTISDNFHIDIVNLSNTANVNFTYSTLHTINTPTVLQAGRTAFLKVDGILVGR
jgi:hypothetical protein